MPSRSLSPLTPALSRKGRGTGRGRCNRVLSPPPHPLADAVMLRRELAKASSQGEGQDEGARHFHGFESLQLLNLPVALLAPAIEDIGWKVRIALGVEPEFSERGIELGGVQSIHHFRSVR